MQYKFLKIKVGLINSILIFGGVFTVSCTSAQKNIYSNNFDFGDSKAINVKLDSLVGVFIASQEPNHFNKMGVALISEDLNNWESSDLFIRRLPSVTYLYAFPATGYFIHDNILVVYYDKKKGFSDPICYPPKFLYEAKKRLTNDWDFVKKDCSSKYMVVDDYVSDHSPFYIFDGKSFKVVPKFEFGKNVYGIPNYNRLFEVNYENFRIVYKHCE